MEVLADVVTTQTIHTRVIGLSNAPWMVAGYFYYPDMKWQVEKITFKWVEDGEPVSVTAEGTDEKQKPFKKSYGWQHVPTWMKEILDPKPEEMKPTYIIHRKKTKTGSYDLIDKVSGKKIAEAHLTGRYNVDNYPWDWYLADGLRFGGDKKANTGTCDTLWACIDVVQARANTYGIVDSATLSKEKP